MSRVAILACLLVLVAAAVASVELPPNMKPPAELPKESHHPDAHHPGGHKPDGQKPDSQRLVGQRPEGQMPEGQRPDGSNASRHETGHEHKPGQKPDVKSLQDIMGQKN